MTRLIAGKELKERILASIVRDYSIADDVTYQIQTVKASDLIVPERAYFLAKFLYIHYHVNNIKSTFGEKLYAETIRAITFGHFSDKNTRGKNSLKEFLEKFNEVIDAQARDEFDFSKTLIPVNNRRMVIDGAHRTVASAYFDKRIPVVTIDSPRAFDISARALKRYGMSSRLIDMMMNTANQTVRNINTLLVMTDSDIEKPASEMIGCYGQLFYAKRLKLTPNGNENIINQLKRFNDKISISGVGKSKFLFLFLFAANANDVADRRLQKDISSLGAHNVYITSTHEESKILGDMLLNHNSLHLLNHANPKTIEEALPMLREIVGPKDRSGIVDFSATLALYNGEAVGQPAYIVNDKHALDDIIYNPKNHFSIDGIMLPAIHSKLPINGNGISGWQWMYLKKQIFYMSVSGLYLDLIPAWHKRAVSRVKDYSYRIASKAGLLPTVKRLKEVLEAIRH